MTEREKAKNYIPIEQAERFSATKSRGLSAEQVNLRVEQGLVNFSTGKKTRSVARIVTSNVFTFFNMLYVAIAAVLIAFGLWQECMFLFVIVANTAIAIFQEIRSKKTLDRLNFVTVPSALVTRDGEKKSVLCNEIVLDDVVEYATGNQISCDAVVLDGAVEVNESMLTGESDSVVKKKGDTLFAGSYVVSGNCVSRVDKVGKSNYIESLAARAKTYQKPKSELLRSLRGILVLVAIIIVPMLFFLWQSNANANGYDWSQGVSSDNAAFLNTLRKTAGSIISMVPVGPLLLTSIALAVSVINLAKKRTVVQELYCIEMLARVNCLCLDKTGTLTDGTMRVVDVVDMRNSIENYTLREIMSSFLRAQNDDNLTSIALKDYFGAPRQPVFKATGKIAFSSQRKFSAVSFGINGTYILGAPEYVLKSRDSRVDEFYKRFTKEGLRVLLLAHSPNEIFKNELPAVRKAVCLIVIEDHIRADAPATIDWFKRNNVEIKIISGDNPQTVSAIAIRAGVENADKYVSLEGMEDDQVKEAALNFNVFGRVSPDQKAVLIKALKANGRTVAMTGDGVNDVLAMKESDCSVALAGGADAARSVSHLVLMDDNFAAMPQVVAEGRRVVNNIERAASMYYMKTIYIIFINILLIVMNFGFHIPWSSPYSSNQILMLETVIVGLATMFLALQPNENIIKGHFLPNLLRRCMPFSLTFIFVTVAAYVLQYLNIVPMNNDALSTVVSVAYTFCGLWALADNCRPYDRKWKYVLLLSVAVVTIAGLCALYYVGNNGIFGMNVIYTSLNTEQFLLMLVLILASAPLMIFLLNIFAGKRKKE